MNRKLSKICWLVISLLAISVRVSAHHGAASYDTSKTVTLKGTVTNYIWSNPHVFLDMDVKSDDGTIVHWVIEAQGPVPQADAGWTRSTFKQGDEVIVDVTPVKNGKPIGRFKGRIIINGQVFKP